MLVEELRQYCRELLESGQVNVIIGYGQNSAARPAFPVFITSPDEVSRLVWNNFCFNNLTVFLKRKEIRALGKPAIIVKGCDEKTLLVLEKESQLERDKIHVIGMACDGVGAPLESKCQFCEVHQPRFADRIIGKATASSPVDAEARFARLNEFRNKTQEERWNYWMEELSRCVKCYACRQVCPLCYCEQCIADKNRPTCIDTSPSLKGNLAWQIARTFHLAGRCIGCGECVRACPAGINLGLLNQTLGQAAEEQFNYRPGMDTETEPILGAYSTADKENFIR